MLVDVSHLPDALKAESFTGSEIGRIAWDNAMRVPEAAMK